MNERVWKQFQAVFSKYWVVFPERINDYIDKYFLQPLYL